MNNYDLIVIGSGPAGEKAAVKAAYFNKRVALIEKESRYGGAGVHTGTLPSKTLKETALYFSGMMEKGLFGVDKKFDNETSIKDFLYRKNFIVSSENSEVHNNLLRHNVDIYHGTASFEDEHTVSVITDNGQVLLYGKFVLIATGSYPFQPEDIPFDVERVHDSDTILNLKKIPKSLCIVGAGVIGCEYATIFAAMGTKVYLIKNQDRILTFLDGEICNSLVTQMENIGIDILYNNSRLSIEKTKTSEEQLTIRVNDQKVINSEMFLYAAGRVANSAELACEKAGVKFRKRGVIEVDEWYQTSSPHIYAAGDVIGFPSLASVSMEQGRVAVSRMFNIHDLPEMAKELPYGIYTIPEVSMIGKTEEQAIAEKIDFCTGIAKFSDMPRGKIMGLEAGFLKLVFHRETRQVIGVHIIGQLASELIHFGMMLVHNQSTITDLIETVFNYPTLHDLYKYAAYDGLGNLNAHKIKHPKE